MADGGEASIKRSADNTAEREKSMLKSEQSLRDAFAGESQANRKYLAYAEKADNEGYPQVGRMFRAAAAAETVHAHNHLRALGAIGTTEENLKDAIAGETHEFKSMYPEMIEHANAEENEKALRSFELANAVERTHAELYEGLLGALGSEQTPVRAVPAGSRAPVCR